MKIPKGIEQLVGMVLREVRTPAETPDGEEDDCAICNAGMSTPPSWMERTAICNPCAQEAVVKLAEFIKGEIERQEKRRKAS